MRYNVSAMKQIGSENRDFACFVQRESEQAVRDLLNDYWVIVLSVKEITAEIQTLAQTYCTVVHKENTISIGMASNDVAACVHLLMQSWFALQWVTNIQTPYNQEQSQTLIQNIYNEIVQENKQEQVKEEAQQAQHKQQFDDKQVQKVQRIIEQTLTDSDWLIQRVTWRAPWTQIKQLQEYQEELKKVRMWSNVSRMTEILENVFKLMETIELTSLEEMKQEELHVMTDSVISDIDISWEIDKYKRAQQVSEAGTAKSSDDSYYIFFGKVWLYQSFLKKDLWAKLKKVSSTRYGLYAAIELLFIFAAIGFWLYIFVQKVLFDSDIALHYFDALISLSILSFLFVMTNMVVKRNTVLVIISGVCIFVGYIIVRYLIDVNFAL